MAEDVKTFTERFRCDLYAWNNSQIEATIDTFRKTNYCFSLLERNPRGAFYFRPTFGIANSRLKWWLF